ncbi:MAG: CoA pyrophosphatase [Pseudomonadota bacterium]
MNPMVLSLSDIEDALALPPLGDRSDFDLAPKFRPAPGSVRERPAAVLCPLVERTDGLRVVLTVRSKHLKHHAGQISFPGGKVDDGDASTLDAALREAEEEIGLARPHVRVVGELDAYLTSTAFRVSPFVGLVPPEWRGRPEPGEVDEIFECPLDFLMDPSNRVQHHREWQGGRRYFYAMPWGEYYIWGATAGMLKGLSDRLERLGRLPGGNDEAGARAGEASAAGGS